MRRDEDCKDCSWNFGKPDFPCSFCEKHDLYIDFIPHHKSEDEEIQRLVKGMISATIYLLISVVGGIDVFKLFTYFCPQCNNRLEPTQDNPDYFMCHKCIKGWTREELEEECRDGKTNNDSRR